MSIELEVASLREQLSSYRDLVTKLTSICKSQRDICTSHSFQINQLITQNQLMQQIQQQHSKSLQKLEACINENDEELTPFDLDKLLK